MTFALAAGPIGALIDRFGPKTVIPMGVVVLAAGLVLMSAVTSRFTLYLYYGVFVALGVTLIGMIPTSTIVSRWFVKRRATALGIVHSGRSAGSLILVPLSALLIGWYGWRSAYLFIAAAVIVLLLWHDPTSCGVAPTGHGRLARLLGTNDPDALCHTRGEPVSRFGRRAGRVRQLLWVGHGSR